MRESNNREPIRQVWWLRVDHARTCEKPWQSRKIHRHPPRFKTPRFRLAQHPTSLPTSTSSCIRPIDDYSFGVLHSRLHEVWARSQGTQVRERESGFRYTPTTCFETFPFPEPTDDQKAAIAEAAKQLDAMRTGWLNPPEWTREEVLEFPGSVDGPWSRYVHEPDHRGIGTVRYPRAVPRDRACAATLAKRTLTNLYNERPTWLDLAHRRLDEAVFAAYGWDPAISDEDAGRPAGTEPPAPPAPAPAADDPAEDEEAGL